MIGVHKTAAYHAEQAQKMADLSELVPDKLNQSILALLHATVFKQQMIV